MCHTFMMIVFHSTFHFNISTSIFNIIFAVSCSSAKYFYVKHFFVARSLLFLFFFLLNVIPIICNIKSLFMLGGKMCFLYVKFKRTVLCSWIYIADYINVGLLMILTRWEIKRMADKITKKLLKKIYENLKEILKSLKVKTVHWKSATIWIQTEGWRTRWNGGSNSISDWRKGKW